MKIVIAGASGLIGRRLVAAFRSRGDSVSVLVRGPKTHEDQIPWNPNRGELDSRALEGVDALVHLSGESIAGGRWTRAVKTAILESRVKSTALLSSRILACANPPRTFVVASAIGVYGDRGDELLDELSAHGKGFLPEVGVQWEQASTLLESGDVRVARMRLGIVLAKEGGALAKMWLPFSLGLGGVVGPGTQYMSWVHIDDAVEAFVRAVDDSRYRGAINVVSPTPITNREFTKAFGKALGRPTLVPLPAMLVSLLFGEMGRELLLGSTRVAPAVLRRHGFVFQFPAVDAALAALVSGNKSERSSSGS